MTPALNNPSDGRAGQIRRGDAAGVPSDKGQDGADSEHEERRSPSGSLRRLRLDADIDADGKSMDCVFISCIISTDELLGLFNYH